VFSFGNCRLTRSVVSIGTTPLFVSIARDSAIYYIPPFVFFGDSKSNNVAFAQLPHKSKQRRFCLFPCHAILHTKVFDDLVNRIITIAQLPYIRPNIVQNNHAFVGQRKKPWKQPESIVSAAGE
jgi:hypothetical protein